MDQSVWRTITKPGRYPNRDEVSQTGSICLLQGEPWVTAHCNQLDNSRGNGKRGCKANTLHDKMLPGKETRNGDDRKLGYTIVAQKNHGKNSALGAAKQINSRNDCEEEALCSKSHKKGLPKDPMLKHATATKALISLKEQNRPNTRIRKAKPPPKLPMSLPHPLRSFEHQIQSLLTACLDCQESILNVLKEWTGLSQFRYTRVWKTWSHNWKY